MTSGIVYIKYNIHYKKSTNKNFKGLSAKDKMLIKATIENKLTANPLEFSEKLKHSLKGYRKLRVGDYRIVFKIIDKDVIIALIKHRSKVYK